MKSSLLIGNGLNNCLKNSISWRNLLEGIAKEYGVEYNGNISMPLEFECIVNQILKHEKVPSPQIYRTIKEKVAEIVKGVKLGEDCIHHRLLELPIDAIMTTNYDNLLEYIYNSGYKYSGDKKNTYRFDPISIQKGVPFYHVHGFADVPKTICLGYEHYMGVVEKIRSEINTEENNKDGHMKIVLALNDRSRLKNTWYERFYTDNISIVGLGLTESEVDLWWLITHRAYLFYSNYHDVRKKLTNRITYYDIVDTKDEVRFAQKKKIHYMLKNANVEVKTLKLEQDCNSYEEGYEMIFASIKNAHLN